MNINIFVRQCLTETTSLEVKRLIQEIMNVLQEVANNIYQSSLNRIQFLPGQHALVAKYKYDFHEHFFRETGETFTSTNFQRWRDQALMQADLFFSIRTSMSESTAFELGQFAARFPQDWKKRSFIFCCSLPQAELKTTLLKETTVVEIKVKDNKLTESQALHETLKKILLQAFAQKQKNTAAFFAKSSTVFADTKRIKPVLASHL